MITKINNSGYRFPPEIIQQAIWLYVQFTLSFRDVEELLAERGIVVISLSIGATGSHVPHKSLKQVHAALMPDAV